MIICWPKIFFATIILLSIKLNTLSSKLQKLWVKKIIKYQNNIFHWKAILFQIYECIINTLLRKDFSASKSLTSLSLPSTFRFLFLHASIEFSIFFNNCFFCSKSFSKPSPSSIFYCLLVVKVNFELRKYFRTKPLFSWKLEATENFSFF